MFKKHRKAADHMLLAMAAFKEGDATLAATHMKRAANSRDFALAMEEIDVANEEVFEDPEEESGEDPALEDELARLLAASEEEEDLDEDDGDDGDDDEAAEEEELSRVRRRTLSSAAHTRRSRNLRAIARAAKAK